jgi:coenzyme F420-reducing hydrogenase delta subunit
MIEKYVIGMVGVICLSAIEITALVMGVDGVFLAGIVGAISGMVAGICGFTIGVTQAKKEAEK